jgi:hypothetical protein
LQDATEALEEEKPIAKKTKTRKIKEVIVPELIEGNEEVIEIVPVPKKKTTRRKKEVDFIIQDDI